MWKTKVTLIVVQKTGTAGGTWRIRLLHSIRRRYDKKKNGNMKHENKNKNKNKNEKNKLNKKNKQ